MENGITKEQSKCIQGLAILMMLYHHLFSTPEALGIKYKSLLLFGNINVELKLAWFFKICVGLYAFVSGYGLYKSFKLGQKDTCSFGERLLTDYKIILKKLFNLYSVFWLVFIIFVPIGFIFFNKSFEIKEFILGFLGLSNSYNGAWWYILQYLKMLLVLPLVDVAFHWYISKKDRIIWILYIGIAVVAVIILYFVFPNDFDATLQFFQPAFFLCFLMGYIISRFGLYELFYKLLGQKVMYILGILGFILVIAARIKIAKDASSAGLDFIFVPVFVYGFCVILCLCRPAVRFFAFFGKYSTIMWLVHVFYYDHYAKGVVMATHFSTGIYLTLLILSVVTAIILNIVHTCLHKRVIQITQKN